MVLFWVLLVTPTVIVFGINKGSSLIWDKVIGVIVIIILIQPKIKKYHYVQWNLM